MIDDFYGQAWADNHARFAANMCAGLTRLACWLRRGAKAEDATPAISLNAGQEASRNSRSLNSISSINVAIAPEPATSAAAQYCLAEYYRELNDRFEGGFDPGLSLFPSLDEFAAPRGIFLIIRVDGEPVGCGGLKPISADAAYLKRMWIAPEVRGIGLARRLLSALEDQAKMLGYSIVRLETNRTLVEAQRLYRSSGYCEVSPFNDEPYAHHWFEKALDLGMDTRPQGRTPPLSDARRVAPATAPQKSGAHRPLLD